MRYSVTHIGPAMAAAFVESLVEAVEGQTIVIAAGTFRGWRRVAVGA